jgi:sugar phosphate isomerase/epimerase
MYTTFDPHFLRLPGETAEYLDIIVKYGIGGVGVNSNLLDDEPKALELARKVWDRNLRWSVMFTPVDFYAPSVDDARFAEGIELFKRRCGVAEKMKVEFCYNHVWSSNADRDYAENFEWHINRLQQVQGVCGDHGIRYGLEFLGPRQVLYRFKHPFIHTIAGVVALSDAAGGKAGFLFDTYHWSCEGARPDDLYYAATHVDRMCGFHVNDGVFGRPMAFQLDLERAMPMTTGAIDAATPYKLFERSGYDGPCACEPLWPTIDIFKNYDRDRCVKEMADAYARCAK